MLRLVLLALLASGPDGATVQQNNARAIATARAAVSDMLRIAATPEEKSLAEKDRGYVERAAALLAQRAATDAGAGAKRPKEPAAAADARQVQEAQMSFNMQYLQLQEQMQNENRSYTAVSNIMKTKHDTVKNSIGNIR